MACHWITWILVFWIFFCLDLWYSGLLLLLVLLRFHWLSFCAEWDILILRNRLYSKCCSFLRKVVNSYTCLFVNSEWNLEQPLWSCSGSNLMWLQTPNLAQLLLLTLPHSASSKIIAPMQAKTGRAILKICAQKGASHKINLDCFHKISHLVIPSLIFQSSFFLNL